MNCSLCGSETASHFEGCPIDIGTRRGTGVPKRNDSWAEYLSRPQPPSVCPELDPPGYPLGEPSRAWGGSVSGDACLTQRLLDGEPEEERERIRAEWITARRHYIETGQVI